MRKLKQLQQLLITEKLLNKEAEQERVKGINEQIQKIRDDEKYNIQHNKLEKKFKKFGGLKNE
jgi:hypothetical protein